MRGLVAAGKTNAEIARLLRISPGTVRKHLENTYGKLGVHTRTAAVAALFQLEVETAQAPKPQTGAAVHA